MRLVFLGTPAFAIPTLERILQAGHHVLAVYTQPDRPKGRGQELAASPVKQAALKHGLEIRQPARIKAPEAVAELRGLAPEAMVVVGYGQIIPQSIIDIPALGIINVHASLLPKYRGAAPIQWAIARGEAVTGVTTMKIDAGLDTGDMLLARETPIGADETASELAERLAPMGADLLVETLAGLQAGGILPRKQDATLASYAPILCKQDGQIDWYLACGEVYNRVRGLAPWPGAFTSFREQRLHVWRARPGTEPVPGGPGAILSTGGRLWAGCAGGGSLELLEVQLEGKRRVAVDAFMNGQHLKPGEAFGEITK